MKTDLITLITIFGMAFVTYITRAGGFFIVNRIKITGRIEAFLMAIPGAILISIVAPALFNGGIKEGLAGMMTLIIAFKTKNLFFSMITGVILVCLFRNLV